MVENIAQETTERATTVLLSPELWCCFAGRTRQGRDPRGPALPTHDAHDGAIVQHLHDFREEDIAEAPGDKAFLSHTYLVCALTACHFAKNAGVAMARFCVTLLKKKNTPMDSASLGPLRCEYVLRSKKMVSGSS